MIIKLFYSLIFLITCFHASFGQEIVFTALGIPPEISIKSAQSFKKVAPLEIEIQNNTKNPIVFYKRAFQLVIYGVNGSPQLMRLGVNGNIPLSKNDFIVVGRNSKHALSLECNIFWEKGGVTLSGRNVDKLWWVDRLPFNIYKLSVRYSYTPNKKNESADFLSASDKQHLITTTIESEKVDLSIARQF